jgi:hypothetical protein
MTKNVTGGPEKVLADKDVKWALQVMLDMAAGWLSDAADYLDDEIVLKQRAAFHIVQSAMSTLDRQLAERPEYRCPDCGHEKIGVKAEISAKLDRNGDLVDIDPNDSSFDQDSHAVCQGCFTEGPLKKFRA